MCLMVAANHMLIVFLGIEMASVPSYVLVGVLKDRRKSAEAALKFAVFGAGAAGVMLYGISLLVGTLGTAHLATMSVQLAALLGSGGAGSRQLVLALAGLMILVGFAFKLSAVPFHFWTPDAFEGATAEVGAFLSIASKAAALALLVRVGLGLGHLPSEFDRAAIQPAVFTAEAAAAPEIVEGISQPVLVAAPGSSAALRPVRLYCGWLIAILAGVTCTFGNLAAYGQDNMKRLLAYSTIAHAGYMLMPLAAAILLAGADPAAARLTVAALAFYIAVYLLMNLGAFAFVAFLRNAIASEELPDYAGLVRRSPGLVVCVAVIMFSLVGLPPLAGFSAKFAIFAQTYKGGLLWLVAIGVANTLVSLFYYLRVVKTMVLDPQRAGRPARRSASGPIRVFLRFNRLPARSPGCVLEPAVRPGRARCIDASSLRGPIPGHGPIRLDFRLEPLAPPCRAFVRRVFDRGSPRELPGAEGAVGDSPADRRRATGAGQAARRGDSPGRRRPQSGRIPDRFHRMERRCPWASRRTCA